MGWPFGTPENDKLRHFSYIILTKSKSKWRPWNSVEKFAIDYLGPVIDDRLYQMSHSAKIVSAIFYEHALTAILAVSVIHAMKREHLAVSAMLAASVARVIWRDSLAKIADTKTIGIDTQ